MFLIDLICPDWIRMKIILNKIWMNCQWSYSFLFCSLQCFFKGSQFSFLYCFFKLFHEDLKGQTRDYLQNHTTLMYSQHHFSRIFNIDHIFIYTTYAVLFHFQIATERCITYYSTGNAIYTLNINSTFEIGVVCVCISICHLLQLN